MGFLSRLSAGTPSRSAGLIGVQSVGLESADTCLNRGERKARDRRRLAAIVSADVAGYSRLMGEDEGRTLAALKAHRRELIDPKIAEYGGRIVKTTGDGLLLDFPSVVDAVRCTVDVQRGMAARNTGVRADQRIDFRVGINVGDIIIDGDDIFGDGVNVAARLQALADPGQICVSKVVRDQVLDKLSYAFDELGAQQVKNIARPVEVYRVRDDLSVAATSESLRVRISRQMPWRWLVAVGGSITVAALVIAIVYRGWPGLPLTGGDLTTPDQGLPRALSIAILPFSATNVAAADQLSGESVTQDITATIARTAREAWVVSHAQVRRYRDQPFDVRAIGRELNVRYLGEGEIRSDGDVLSIYARLIDAGNATEIWSDHVDIVGGQQSTDGATAVAQLANLLRIALIEAESRRVEREPSANSTAVDLVLRGYRLEDGSLRQALEARKLYDEALRRDPRNVLALQARAWTDITELYVSPHADHDRLVQEIDDLSLRAIESDQDDRRTWYIRGFALELAWRWDASLDAFAQVLRLDPQFTGAYTMRAWVLTSMWRVDEAFAEFNNAIAVDPRAAKDPQLLHFRCRTHLLLGHYDDAIHDCELAAARESWFGPRVWLTAAYAQKGELAKAQAAKGELLKRNPGYSIARAKSYRMSDNPTYLQQAETHLYAGLRKAGIPDE